MALCPYAPRHGGASSDALLFATSGPSSSRRGRSIGQIAKCGRWMSQKNVRRYEKHGLLLQQWKRVPQEIQARADSAARELLDGLNKSFG